MWHRISPAASSGWRSASCSATNPPAEWPKTSGRSIPSAGQSAATSSAICSSVHDSTRRRAGAALSAQVDEHELRVAGQRAQAGAEVALIKARAAVQNDHRGAPSQLVAGDRELGALDVEVQLGVVDGDAHDPEMHRAPRKFGSERRTSRAPRASWSHGHERAASSRHRRTATRPSRRKNGVMTRPDDATLARAAQAGDATSLGSAVRAPPRAPARCRGRDARPRPRRRRRRPRRDRDRYPADRRAARAGRRRRLAGRHPGQRLPRAAAPPRPRAAGRGRRRVARRARHRAGDRGARRAARLGVDRAGAPARAPARGRHAAPLLDGEFVLRHRRHLRRSGRHRAQPPERGPQAARR